MLKIDRRARTVLDQEGEFPFSELRFVLGGREPGDSVDTCRLWAVLPSGGRRLWFHEDGTPVLVPRGERYLSPNRDILSW